MRTDFLDYPTAWAIQNEVGPSLDHDPKCSSVPGHHPMAGPAFLCDCGAVEREWERRVLLIDYRRFKVPLKVLSVDPTIPGRRSPPVSVPADRGATVEAQGGKASEEPG
jgi:hypothetical protein